VLDVYLTENGVAVLRRDIPIVGHDDASHGIEEHFEHGLRAKGGGHYL